MRDKYTLVVDDKGRGLQVMILEDNGSTYTLRLVSVYIKTFLLSYLFLDGNTQWESGYTQPC